MKNVLLFLFCLAALNTSSQIPKATGLIFDDSKYLQTDRLSFALKWTEADLPNLSSLKLYCPTPGNQGEIGSCVAWATGYAALTISMAIQNNVTDRAQITNMAKSALYIYNQIKRSDACSPGGSVLDDAMRLVQTKGD